MLALAIATLIALVVGLVLRFAVDPQPEDAVGTLRQFALIGSFAALHCSRLATTTAAEQLSAFGRALVLRLFPGLDATPAPVTPAAARWTPVTQRIAAVALLGSATWFMGALIGWLATLVL